jgi:hypothetical protein
LGKRYAVLTTLEWSDRKKDGTSVETRVEAGEVRSDIPSASVSALLATKAIEPYVRTKHRAGWWEKRQQAETDKRAVAAGGVPSAEIVDEGDNRTIKVADHGTSRETR